MPVQTRPYCVYCGATAALTPSAIVPDGTLYPGVQMMCANGEACGLRIHEQYHAEARAPECHYCGQPLTGAARPSDA